LLGSTDFHKFWLKGKKKRRGRRLGELGGGGSPGSNPVEGGQGNFNRLSQKKGSEKGTNCGPQGEGGEGARPSPIPIWTGGDPGGSTKRTEDHLKRIRFRERGVREGQLTLGGRTGGLCWGPGRSPKKKRKTVKRLTTANTKTNKNRVRGRLPHQGREPERGLALNRAGSFQGGIGVSRESYWKLNLGGIGEFKDQPQTRTQQNGRKKFQQSNEQEPNINFQTRKGDCEKQRGTSLKKENQTEGTVKKAGG